MLMLLEQAVARTNFLSSPVATIESSNWAEMDLSCSDHAEQQTDRVCCISHSGRFSKAAFCVPSVQRIEIPIVGLRQIYLHWVFMVQMQFDGLFDETQFILFLC